MLDRRSVIVMATCLTTIFILSSCRSVHSRQHASPESPDRTFVLKAASADEVRKVLSALRLGRVTSAPEPNTLTVSGSLSELQKAAVVIDLIDVNVPYAVRMLAPASAARTLPSNRQIADAIGHAAIGTFAAPPARDAGARVLIDIHGESVMALAPMHLGPDIYAVVTLGSDALPLKNTDEVRQRHARDVPMGTIGDVNRRRTALDTPLPATISAADTTDAVSPDTGEPNQPAATADAETSAVAKAETALKLRNTPGATPDPNAVTRGVLKPSRPAAGMRAATSTPVAVPFTNGEEVLELSLPEKIELAQLIDLTGEYLHLDCMYDAEKLGNQTVTLKLHSKLRSEITVRDLYSLLETILRFKGLAMIRQGGNLVTIVPVAEALNADPELVDPNSTAIQAGNVVITRVFVLQYVDAASVTNLLNSMKLSVTTSAIEDTQTLFVTCYANRMPRIEQLVNMVDRPGRPKEFRFRQLKYTLARTLAQKILTLASELEDMPVTIAPTAAAEAAAGGRGNAPRRPQSTAEAPPAKAGATSSAVYLDTDERTNRLLMIGSEEQLVTVDALIDTLDVPQQDMRFLHVYQIKHVQADEVLRKLSELAIIGSTSVATGRSARTSANAVGAAPEAPPGEEPQVVLLQVTNSLLVNATTEQHEQIQTIIDHVDVMAKDLRTFRTYRIVHGEASEVLKKLHELGFTSKTAAPVPAPRRTSLNSAAAASASSPAAPAPASVVVEEGTTDDIQVVVLDVVNSLLINATAEQHKRLTSVISYLDVEAQRERMPYEVYFLESQEPEKLADVLSKLVRETITNKEGKIEAVIQKTDEEITILPDAGTCSLIVYASRRNQEWIAEMVKRLDRRRPQVLIDVTLVEISKTQAFSYDLNLIQSIPDLTATSGLTGTIVGGSSPVTSADMTARLAASGRSQFADYQSNGGDFTGFYGDKHINLLLTAIESKNYGRVLAKPKILVNDNQPGTIKTADTTYVAKRSSIPVSTASGGNQATLVETSVDYTSYEAGITLNITPHISDSELLKLDIELVRSDFRETADTEKPPDTTTSEVTTKVFVPDGSTIILGGLLKLNQNKGGSKVPILGDLPLIGGLFRSINDSDAQSKLYVFVKAEIIRPDRVLARGMPNLDTISQKNREAFEEHESEFQSYQTWPGLPPKPVEPARVLDAQ